WNEDAVLHRIFREQSAVARIDARHHRRVIAGKLIVIRQAFGEMLPDQPNGDAADHGDKQQRAGQERKNSRQSHDRARKSHLLSFAVMSLAATPVPPDHPIGSLGGTAGRLCPLPVDRLKPTGVARSRFNYGAGSDLSTGVVKVW